MSRLENNYEMPTATSAIAGRDTPIQISTEHYVNGHSVIEPFPARAECILFGMGCFWGAERKFWSVDGVFCTSVGYSGGYTKNPSYDEVCSGLTGHNEVVRVVYSPDRCCFGDLLAIFWENHDPTQGMRQGNDRGTQYRSGIYTYSEAQQTEASQSKAVFQEKLLQSGFGPVTSEIVPAKAFYFAEDYHQQYLAKNPQGYCGLGGTGVCF